MESSEAKAFYESCPECGGEVHRIANRCKHCGADRSARTQQPEPAPEPEPAPAPAPAPEPGAWLPSPSPPPPSPTSRKWMLAGAGVLILAIGMALGILIERDSESETRPAAANPYVEVARPSDEPPPPDVDDPDPGITFNWSFRSRPRAQAHAPSGGDLTVDQFVSRLGNELCDKVTECANADPAVGILCRTIAANIQTDDVADKVASGECDYDPAAAASCVNGLESLDCSASGSASDPMQDPLAMMMTVDSIMSCLEALRCSAW